MDSKADTLFRPACEQTLVLVNPFSKVKLTGDEHAYWPPRLARPF